MTRLARVSEEGADFRVAIRLSKVSLMAGMAVTACLQVAVWAVMLTRMWRTNELPLNVFLTGTQVLSLASLDDLITRYVMDYYGYRKRKYWSVFDDVAVLCDMAMLIPFGCAFWIGFFIRGIGMLRINLLIVVATIFVYACKWCWQWGRFRQDYLSWMLSDWYEKEDGFWTFVSLNRDF